MSSCSVTMSSAVDAPPEACRHAGHVGRLAARRPRPGRAPSRRVRRCRDVSCPVCSRQLLAARTRRSTRRAGRPPPPVSISRPVMSMPSGSSERITSLTSWPTTRPGQQRVELLGHRRRAEQLAGTSDAEAGLVALGRDQHERRPARCARACRSSGRRTASAPVAERADSAWSTSRRRRRQRRPRAASSGGDAGAAVGRCPVPAAPPRSGAPGDAARGPVGRARPARRRRAAPRGGCQTVFIS